MRALIYIILVFCGFAPMASAQIVSQNPRPVIKADVPDSVEVIEQNIRIGAARSLIQIPRTGALLFAGFDHNNDYIIDIGEVNAGINKAFAFADRDKNGVLSLVELEAWRIAALGSTDAAPHNFAFAPNFARTVSKDKFQFVLSELAAKLDLDVQGDRDGKIAIADLLKNFNPRSIRRGDDEKCSARILEERERAERLCRANVRR